MQNAVKRLRLVIDNIDSLLVKLLSKRLKTSAAIQKIKSSGLFFSPSREKQILSKCPDGRLTDIYMAVLRNSRNAPENIDWHFIAAGNPKADGAAMEYFRKIFGGGIKLKNSKSVKDLNAAPGKGIVIISASTGIEGDYEASGLGKIYRYCEYRLKKRHIFSFYSSVPPAFESDLDVTISL